MKKQDKNWIIAGGALLGLFLLANRARAASGSGGGSGQSVANLSYLGQTGLPRGMRNNNPGNIRKSNTAWKGKISSTDNAFEQFSAYVWGIRAMIKNLQSYQRDRGLNTLTQLINTWAPAADNNDTSAYIRNVALSSGFSPTQSLNLSDKNTMRKLVRSMAVVENGRDAITDPQFDYAWSIL